jgi:hypothetical protein
MPAYAVRVRDQWLPWKAAGHPALEYCNTYAAGNGPRPLRLSPRVPRRRGTRDRGGLAGKAR